MNGLLIVHIIISIALIVLVFIQYGRGGDLGASMGSGGGSANSVFGASGSTDFISKLTGIVGLMFFASALAIGAAYQRNEKPADGGGLMQSYAPKPVSSGKSNAIPVQQAMPVQGIPTGVLVAGEGKGASSTAKSNAIPIKNAPVVPIAEPASKATSVHQVAPKATSGASEHPATVRPVSEQVNELKTKTK